MKPITQEKDRLGFVGIGYMGRPIARRLLESGFKLTAYDRDHSKAEELIQYGGKVALSVSELSSNCNVVLSCLPSDEAVLIFIEDMTAFSPVRVPARASST